MQADTLREPPGARTLQQPADDPALATAAPESVREATLAGVRWGAVARVGIETTSFLSTIALARLIDPAAFGHAAAALAVTAVASSLTVEGFGTPLVQRKEVTRAHIETGLLLSVASGLVLTAFVYLLAPLLTGALGSEGVSLLQLASPVFLAVSLCVVPQALQQRRLNFRTTSLIQLASLAVGVCVGLVLAVLGLGARALVLGQITIPMASAAMFWVGMPRVRPRWHRRETADIVSFGSQTTLSSLLFSAYSNIDYVIVSAQLGARATGYYWRAFQIGGVYQGKISQIMLALALPVYSRTRDLADMVRVRRRIVRVHASVIFPLLAAYVVVAPAAVPLVFGHAWTPTVVPSQVLAFAGMIFALGTGGAALIVAAGHPRAALLNNVVSLAVYFGVVFAFARYGLTTLCIAIVIANVIGYAATYYVIFDRMIGLPMRQLWDEAGPALVSLIALFACALPVARALSAAGVPGVLQIVVEAPVALLAYAATMRLAYRDAWSDLVLLARRVIGRRRGASA